MQRVHDNVSGNWQKFTTIGYEINKSMDLKKRTGNHFWKKTFLNLVYDNDKKENTLIYAHHIFYKIIALSMNLIIIQNWMKKEY